MPDPNADRQEQKTSGHGEHPSVAVILNPRDPMHSARVLVATRFTDSKNHRLLHHHRGSFWRLQSNYYAPADAETIRAVVWMFLENARRIGDKNKSVPFMPNRTRVSDVIDALASVCHLDGAIEPPAWLTDAELSCRRRNVSGRQRAAASAQRRALSGVVELFRPHRVGRDVRSRGGRACALADISRSAVRRRPRGSRHLQDWFGYALAPDTSQQKIFMVVGPRRGGKGTIGRAHRATRARQRDRADAVRAAVELRAGTADRQVAGDHFRRPRRRQVGSGGDCRAAAVDLGRGRHHHRPQISCRPGPGDCQCGSWC